MVFSGGKPEIFASFQWCLGVFKWFRRPFGLVFSAVWWFLGGFRWFRRAFGRAGLYPDAVAATAAAVPHAPPGPPVTSLPSCHPCKTEIFC